MIAAIVWILVLAHSPSNPEPEPFPLSFSASKAECEKWHQVYSKEYKDHSFECRIDTRTLKERACLMSYKACEAGRVGEAIAMYKRCLKKFHDEGICESYATCRGHVLNADGSRMLEPDGTPAGLDCM